MHREWNPKSFFRHLSPEVLAEFMNSARVWFPLSGKGTAGEQLYRAWKALPELRQQRLERELRLVNDMCSSHARSYLEDHARACWGDVKPELLERSRRWSAQDLALRLYLDDAAGFEAVHQAYDLDMMEHFQEFRGRYAVTARPSDSTKQAMKDAMVRHFQATALGLKCQVEDFVNDEKFAVFVYHEDEVTPIDRFGEHGTIEPEWQRPVIRMAAVFYPATCTLLVKSRRKAEREILRNLFGEIMLGDRAYFEDPARMPKFSFNRLQDSRFEFVTRGIDKIDGVSLTQVAVRPAEHRVQRLTIDLRSSRGMADARTSLARMGIDLSAGGIEGIRLQFRFQGQGRARYRTVSLQSPNRSNLRDTARDRVIRQYLQEWGIDRSVREATQQVVHAA